MKKGYKFYNEMSADERAEWLLEFPTTDDFDLQMKSHYANMYLFLVSSFNLRNSRQGAEYWLEISRRKTRTPKIAFVIALIVFVGALVGLFVINKAHVKEKPVKQMKFTEQELELIERLVGQE